MQRSRLSRLVRSAGERRDATALVVAILLSGYVIVASVTSTMGPVRWVAASVAIVCYLFAAYRPWCRMIAAAGYGREAGSAHD